MKILNEANNRHFYLDSNNCLFCVESETCLAHINDKNEKIQFYPSGVLLSHKTVDLIELIFIGNNGKRLFTIYKPELVEMENDIYDIRVGVCGTGVLVKYEYSEQRSDYEYYLYNGTMLTDKNYNTLKRKIEDYEKSIGVYFDCENQNQI